MTALDLIPKYRLWADSITYSELVKCCIDHCAVKEGKTFLVNSLLNMYVKFRLLGEAQTLFDQMPEKNVISWTTMIAAYSNTELYFKAFQMLILMLRDGVRPNMYTYSSVLRSCKELTNLMQLHCCIIKVGLESDVFVKSACLGILGCKSHFVLK
ncbi:hypothetical protein F511_22395 [Dorcoceras hygrometricum]|uniref:Pentatricopeptide repeat-containing protein n=1 Tax=Dorcoceras hygrometricum TaxID=472368 RepID=A0A2Z7B5C9_9LAMI|nr:hypothetical protein F511_22395 [Dorcoceras hygrometricum]